MTTRPGKVTAASLSRVVDSATKVYTAIVDSRIVGTTSLTASPVVFAGEIFQIQEVVVDESQRGKGIAKQLMEFAIERARELGAEGVSLTSTPKRVEARNLYAKLGFKEKETDVFVLEF